MSNETGNRNLKDNVETKIYPPYLKLRLVRNRGSTSEDPPYENVSLQGIDHSISFYIELSSIQKGMFYVRTCFSCVTGLQQLGLLYKGFLSNRNILHVTSLSNDCLLTGLHYQNVTN